MQVVDVAGVAVAANRWSKKAHLQREQRKKAQLKAKYGDQGGGVSPTTPRHVCRDAPVGLAPRVFPRAQGMCRRHPADRLGHGHAVGGSAQARAHSRAWWPDGAVASGSRGWRTTPRRPVHSVERRPWYVRSSTCRRHATQAPSRHRGDAPNRCCCSAMPRRPAQQPSKCRVLTPPRRTPCCGLTSRPLPPTVTAGADGMVLEFGQFVRAASRSIPPPRGSIRFRPPICT